MATDKVWWSGAWLDLGGGAADPSDQFPSHLLDDGVTTASSIRAAITATAHATPHTEGSWVEVDPSLSADASGIYVHINTATNSSTANSSTLLEIGTGAGGAETVWAKAGIGYRTTDAEPIIVPGHIAAGTRVAVRVRSAITLQAVTAVYSFLSEKASAGFGAPVTYGASTTTSHGTILTPHASLNTKSAWTELVASTATDLAALLVTVQAAEATTMSASGVLVDIGTGAVSSETVLIPDIYYSGLSTEVYQPRSPTLYGVDIPAGTRIAGRFAQANANNDVDVVLVGAPPA